MNNSKNNQIILDQEVMKLFNDSRRKHVIIIVLYKGKHIPRFTSPMLRNPKPKTNILLNGNLLNIYFEAIDFNPSIEDGAIMIQEKGNNLILTGFSYKLYAPPLNVTKIENMGSGYNSALDYSGVKNIQCVYLINSNGMKKFINGREINL